MLKNLDLHARRSGPLPHGARLRTLGALRGPLRFSLHFCLRSNGSSILGTAQLSAGAASLTTSSLAAGIYTITASYPGDSNFAASTSPGLRQVVNSTTKSATATTLVSSLSPSTYGPCL